MTVRRFLIVLTIAVVVLGGLFMLRFIARVNAEAFLDGQADLTIVHLTDLHLSSGTNQRLETAWPNKIIINGYKLHKPCFGKAASFLEETVAIVNSRIRPDIVVVTGDIVNNRSDEEAFRMAQNLLHKIECPVIVTDGDHDSSRDAKCQFAKYFGSSEGELSLNGYRFFSVPFEIDEADLMKLGDKLRGAQSGRCRILCMHRMLYAPYLMRKLSKVYVSDILAPEKEAVLKTLKECAGRCVVLCGHAHTNYDKEEGNILQLATSSLAEYPYEMRVIKFSGGTPTTRVFSLDEIRRKKN